MGGGGALLLGGPKTFRSEDTLGGPFGSEGASFWCCFSGTC